MEKESYNSSKKMKKNPLENLLIEEEYVIEKLLYELLEPFVRFNKQTGQIIFREPFYQCLDAEGKIIISLAAIYALHLLNLRDDPSISLRDIASITGVNYNTVRPRLSKAGKASKFAEKVKQGVYKFNISKISEAKAFIENQLKKCELGEES